MSAISAGKLVRGALIASEGVKSLLGIVDDPTNTRKIYPLMTTEAKLPYIVYSVTNLVETRVKGGGYDTATVELDCYATTYDTAADIAEAVRDALERRDLEGIRVCYLQGLRDNCTGDAYQFTLTFLIKI